MTQVTLLWAPGEKLGCSVERSTCSASAQAAVPRKAARATVETGGMTGDGRPEDLGGAVAPLSELAAGYLPTEPHYTGVRRCCRRLRPVRGGHGENKFCIINYCYFDPIYTHRLTGPESIKVQ